MVSRPGEIEFCPVDGLADIDEKDLDPTILDLSFRPSLPGGAPTLREQDRRLDEMHRENFSLKLQVRHLEERLNQLTPEHMEAALRENEQFSVRTETLESEVRSYKKLLEDASTKMHQVQGQLAAPAVSGAEHRRMEAELLHARTELEQTRLQLQSYDGQFSRLAGESKDAAQRAKQLEIELSYAQKRLVETQTAVARRGEEIEALKSQLAEKSATVEGYRTDARQLSENITTMSEQIRRLEAELRESDEKRAELSRETDSLRRGIEKADLQLKVGAMSPRKSMDILESKLMRELAGTTKRFNDLEKSKNLTESGRLQLQSQLEDLSNQVGTGGRMIQSLLGKISDCLWPNRPIICQDDDLIALVEQLGDLSSKLMGEFGTARGLLREVETAQCKAQQDFLAMSAECDQLRQELGHRETETVELRQAIQAKGREVEKAQSTIGQLQTIIRSTTEIEVPRYQRELEDAKAKAALAAKEVSELRSSLAAATQDRDDLRRRGERLEAMASQRTAEVNERREQLAALETTREDHLRQLALRETTLKQVAKQMDELNTRVSHADSVKTALEQKYLQQLQALHSANAELRAQLQDTGTSRGDLVQRCERAETALNMAQRTTSDLALRLRERESDLATIQRDHEVLMLEKKALETELAEQRREAARLEAEVARTRREDQTLRKNADGLEHLQARVESLSALNAFLKEQVDQKERSLHALDAKLKKQEADMRTTYEEIESQTRRLKKREMLINQALKRLEILNSLHHGDEVGQVTGELAVAVAREDDLGKRKHGDGGDNGEDVRRLEF